MNFYSLEKFAFWLRAGMNPISSNNITLRKEYKGSIAALYSDGDADIFASNGIDLDSQFCIASISKHMTAFIMLRTLQKLYPQDDLNVLMRMSLNELFPDSDILNHLKNPQWVSETTLLQLIRHKSGLTDDCMGIENEKSLPINYPISSKEIINNALPGADRKYEYSNINYLLLGRLLEELHNDSFDNIFDKFIKKPAGMYSSHAFTIGTYKDLYDKYPRLVEDLEQDMPINIYNFVGAACVISTMRDLFNWVDYFFETDDKDIKQILDLFLNKDNSISKKLSAHQKEINDNPELLGCDSDLLSSYTLGLCKIKVNHQSKLGEIIEKDYFMHPGELDSYCHQFWYMPEEKLAFIILTNADQEFDKLADDCFSFYNNDSGYGDVADSLYTLHQEGINEFFEIFHNIMEDA